MKKAIFFVLIMALISCKKDSGVPDITGDWNVTFITTETSGNTHTGLLSITQNGNDLSGTLNWDGTEKPLLSASNITDIVAIYCENLLFAGTVNKGNDLMEGDLYKFDYFDGLYSNYGTWQAERK